MTENGSQKPLSIYIHIPFCVRKCLYCDFLSAPATDDTIEGYVQSLIKEILICGFEEYRGRSIATVFFGGGTPSLLSVRQTGSILEALGQSFDMEDCREISMEVNPGTVTKEKSTALCKLGIGRFSIGLQSTYDNELQRIGRIHRYPDFLNTYEWLRSAGCENINIDLMSALPGQTAEGYIDGLHKITELRPEHISSYSLILEEGTRLYDMYRGNAPFPGNDEASYRLPDEDEDVWMYEETGRVLEMSGYNRYEISNYSQPGRECRHNTVYWKRGDYLGLGIGAASCVGNVRWKNTDGLHNYTRFFKEHPRADLSEYAKALRVEEAKLSVPEQMEETMFLGLRMMKGVDRERFAKNFGTGIESVYGDVIRGFCESGLLEDDGRFIRLTEKGIPVSNRVFAAFLL